MHLILSWLCREADLHLSNSCALRRMPTAGQEPRVCFAQDGQGIMHELRHAKHGQHFRLCRRRTNAPGQWTSTKCAPQPWGWPTNSIREISWSVSMHQRCIPQHQYHLVAHSWHAPFLLRHLMDCVKKHQMIAPSQLYCPRSRCMVNQRSHVIMIFACRQERNGSGALKLDKEIKAYESHSNLWHVATGDLNPDCYLDWWLVCSALPAGLSGFPTLMKQGREVAYRLRGDEWNDSR